MGTRLIRAGVILALAALPALGAAADLQAIEDRLDIAELVTGRYAIALDTSDADGYANLFTEDAHLNVAGRDFNGRKAIHEMMLEIKKHHDQFDTRSPNYKSRRFGPVRHVVTNPLIKISGNTATSDSYSTEIGSTGRDAKGHGNPQTIMNVCRYEDTLVKQSGQWLFTQRLIICDMFGKRNMGPDTYPMTM